MNMHVALPTETEVAAAKRHRAFHLTIELRAAELKAAKVRAAMDAIGVAQPSQAATVAPEAMAAAPSLEALRSDRTWFWPADWVPFPEVRKIQECVARYYGVTRADLMAARRMKELIRPRHVAQYLAKQLTPLSLPSIGKRFGGRDHTTILHAVRKIEGLVLRDPDVAHDVALLVDVLTDGKGL